MFSSSEYLPNFVGSEIIDLGHDGFPGTVVEIGCWNNQKVAVKYGVKKLHQQEAAILTKLGEHPNIVQLLKKYEDGDCFLVLEAVGGNRGGNRGGNGVSLEKVIDKNVKIPFDKCINWLLQIANGIKHIHDKGIIHGDIKSSNILIDDGRTDERMKLCDFELAVASSFGVKYQGTPRWMAPELKYDSLTTEITNKIDIYAFGLLFLDIIFCGREPIVVKYLCPTKLFDLMYKCSHQDVSQRPSIDEIISVLSSLSSRRDEKNDYLVMQDRLSEIDHILTENNHILTEDEKQTVLDLKTQIENIMNLHFHDFDQNKLKDLTF